MAYSSCSNTPEELAVEKLETFPGKVLLPQVPIHAPHNFERYVFSQKPNEIVTKRVDLYNVDVERIVEENAAETSKAKCEIVIGFQQTQSGWRPVRLGRRLDHALLRIRCVRYLIADPPISCPVPPDEEVLQLWQHPGEPLLVSADVQREICRIASTDGREPSSPLRPQAQHFFHSTQTLYPQVPIQEDTLDKANQPPSRFAPYTNLLQRSQNDNLGRLQDAAARMDSEPSLLQLLKRGQGTGGTSLSSSTPSLAMGSPASEALLQKLNGRRTDPMYRYFASNGSAPSSKERDTLAKLFEHYRSQ